MNENLYLPVIILLDGKVIEVTLRHMIAFSEIRGSATTWVRNYALCVKTCFKEDTDTQYSIRFQGKPKVYGVRNHKRSGWNSRRFTSAKSDVLYGFGMNLCCPRLILGR